MEDFAKRFAITKAPQSRGRKRKKATDGDEPTLSEVISARMHKNPKLKYVGKREKGEAPKYKSLFTRDQEMWQEKINKMEEASKAQAVHISSLDKEVHQLEDLPEDYIYMGGILVKIRGKEIRYLIPRGIDGEKFYKWKLHYWPQIQRICTEQN